MRLLSAVLCITTLPVFAEPVGQDWFASMPPADIVFLGEVHDNPTHHVHQAKAIREIGPASLVFEMLTAEKAARIPATLPPEETLAEILEWEASGWPDFALYHPLFMAAPKARIFGAELPREAARDAMRREITESFHGDAARFGLDMPLPAEQQAEREALQARAHCDALPEYLLPGMVAIQRLRDAMLAETALRAFEATGGPVVVITGTGHARTDWGAPYLLAKAAPELEILALGQFETDLGDNPPYDFWILTDPHPRADPCAAFR